MWLTYANIILNAKRCLLSGCLLLFLLLIGITPWLDILSRETEQVFSKTKPANLVLHCFLCFSKNVNYVFFIHVHSEEKKFLYC